MLLQIKVDPAKSLIAGYEPTDRIDLDLAPLSADDRAAIAAIMSGTRVDRVLDAPTVDALLAAAREARQQREAEKALIAEQVRQRDARDAEQVAALRACVSARQTVSRPVLIYGLGRKIEVTRIEPDLGGISLWAVVHVPLDLKAEIEAWRAECRTLNEAREAEAKAASKAAMDAEIACRANMPLEELLVALGGDQPISGVNYIVADTGNTITLEGPGPCNGLMRRVTVDLMDKTRKACLVDDKNSEFETVAYPVDDGVLKVEGAGWVATVKDPSAVKPDYDFLGRVPGGFGAPDVEPGDVLVWGGKDRKGRKTGPYDRLIYQVSDTELKALKLDYATARRLRKLLVAK